MSKKKRKTPRITTQPRIPHWIYRLHVGVIRPDYALIITTNTRGTPCRTERYIHVRHIPQWMIEAMRLIDLAYDNESRLTVVPGFGEWDKKSRLYTFYAKTTNT